MPGQPGLVAGSSIAVSEAAERGMGTDLTASASLAMGPHPRLLALIRAGRYHGVELDPADYRAAGPEAAPSAASLSAWAQNSGLWSRAVRLRWRHLMRFKNSSPVVLLFRDGTAGLLTGVNHEHKVVFLQDPNRPSAETPVPVDELSLAEVWSGEAVMLRAQRGSTEADEPFSLRWLLRLVLKEKRSLRDISLAALTTSCLKIVPPFIFMTVLNQVIPHKGTSTLLLLSVILAIMITYDTLLEYGRRVITEVVGVRVDTRLNLHVFNRLLRLPLDYFERHPAGETMYRINQIHLIRRFITGRMLTTMIEAISLFILMPFLFFLDATLTWIVIGAAGLLALITLVFLRPLRRVYGRVVAAETDKHAALGETVFGIKTVKALALEPERRSLWDQRVAEAGKWRLAFGKLQTWPQTLAVPIDRFIQLGVVMLGTYFVITKAGGNNNVGGLIAFMMLARTVASPLVSMVRLIEDYEEVRASVTQAAAVLNSPLEVDAASGGLRPKFSGAISFDDVSFTYAGTKTPALDRISFSIPAGTMLGVVGRSGSGKSTLTRLLQGINRDYTGYVKIDGADLREINLRHLRQSFGTVLQDNFLFRGSIRENILAGRPGLTLEDAVAAARLAAAEEFIERMPNGYETYVEEGSPNLSGGQKQRLAIARALITDPRILILDEATSALDPESEALINANLQRISHGRTMVIVSHRLSSLTECDQILVLEQGKVADIGPHETLLERCSVYRQLWAQQNRHLESARHAAFAPAIVSGD